MHTYSPFQPHQENQIKRFKVFPETTSFYYSTLSIIACLPIFQDDQYYSIILCFVAFEFLSPDRNLVVSFLKGGVMVISNRVNISLAFH